MARGLLAQLNRIAKQAARDAERSRKTAERNRLAIARHAEQTRKANIKASTQLARAREQDRKRFEKAAIETHVAAQMALVEMKNAELAETYDDIDTLLQATLDIDDFVDLESLKGVVDHPPFDRADLEKPVPAPAPRPEPSKPMLKTPPPPSWFAALLGKKKYERSVLAAEVAHEKAISVWEAAKLEQQNEFEKAEKRHQLAEAERLQALAIEKERYAAECRAREEEMVERNAEVDMLIASLGYGVPEAIEEYVSIVLSNSVYPEHFPVVHESSLDSATAELKLRVLIPPPSSIPTIKTYKYTKASDEISTIDLTQKTCKDRYSNAVHQVALRTLHEIFEADRRGLIETISLEVGTETIDPATGIRGYIPFIATGVERKTFIEFDLSAVLPMATLKRLGASVSKNPFNLEATDTLGIRRS